MATPTDPHSSLAVAESALLEISSQCIHPLDAAWQTAIQCIGSQLERWQAHPAQTVVLVDHAAMQAVAKDAWRRLHPEGFMPQFHTLSTWCESLPPVILTGLDLHMHYPVDILQAKRWLQIASQQTTQAPPSTQTALTGHVLQSAYELASTLRSIHPTDRPAWAARAQAMLEDAGSESPFQTEQLCTSVALQWAAQSSYATDVLYDKDTLQQFPYLIILTPHATIDALSQRLLDLWSDRAARINALCDATPAQTKAIGKSTQPPNTHCHPCDDVHEQALAVCHHVLQLLHQQPPEVAQTATSAPLARPLAHIALVSLDRGLSRRICALLAQHGVAVDLSSGHKLSTTLAATYVVQTLQACPPDASCDAVLAWLKSCPLLKPDELNLLEQALRRNPLPRWSDALSVLSHSKNSALTLLANRVEAWRLVFISATSSALGSPDALKPTDQSPVLTHAQWLQNLATGLHTCGLWSWLWSRSDGQAVLAQLGWLGIAMPFADGPIDPPSIFQIHDIQLHQHEWLQWVRDSLEQGVWQPTALSNTVTAPTRQAPALRVSLLPLQQVLARPFTQVLIPGCNDTTPAHSYHAAAHFNAQQRSQLGLPTREAHAAHWDHVWQQVLQTQQCHLFWLQHDAAGNTSAPSRWVLQRWQRASPDATKTLRDKYAASSPSDAVTARLATQKAPAFAQSAGHLLPMPALSPSAYADLRQCPYRFWAQRLLQLKSWPEFDDESPERDFGLWLHTVLHQFHLPHWQEAVKRGQSSEAVIDQIANDTLVAQKVPVHFATPWLSSWPSLRDSYLAWQTAHAQQGWTVTHTEQWLEQPLTHGDQTWRLVGKIDRVDTRDQALLVLDYKTESKVRSKARVKDMTEDVQLAFYALLLSDSSAKDAGHAHPASGSIANTPIWAGYLQFHDREGCTLLEQADMDTLALGLRDQVVTDLQRIAQGQPLKALGQAAACTYCHMRGICRKDDWSDEDV